MCINKMSRNVFFVEILTILLFTFCAYKCSVCPNKCSCHGSTVKCDLLHVDGKVEPDLPDGTDHIILKNWGQWNLTWDSVTHLDLLDTSYACNQSILQLRSLISLRIYTKLFFNHFGILDIQSRLGVRELHFSGIKNFSFVDVTSLLRAPRFSTVEVLVIDSISSDNDDPPLIISSSFFTELSTKSELRRLDLTNLNLNSIDILATRCPPKFNYLSIRGSEVDRVESHYGIHKTRVCKTLKTLDASKTTFRQISAVLKVAASFSNMYITGQFFNIYLYRYFRNVENIFLNDINRTPLTVTGFTLDLSSYKFRVRRIDLSHNYAKFLSGTYISHAEIGIEEVNISFNILEYVSPRLFNHANFLRKLDLQSNRLYKMQTDFPVDFVDGFQRLSNLRYLDLSNNQLTEIPQGTFLKNRELRHLDLGHNELTGISFSLSTCAYLEYLNLAGNKIYVRDIKSLEPLNEVVFTRRRNIDNNDKIKTPEAVLKIDLSGNSFSCLCENSDLQTWMVDYSDMLVSNVSDGYMCFYNGKEYNIMLEEVKEISNICYRQHMLRMLLPSLGLIILISMVIIFFIRRRMVRDQGVRQLLQRLHQDEFPIQFLTFMSHCSADDELVIDYILPKLSQSLKEVTKTDRDYICLGDKHFRPCHVIVEEVMRCIEQSAVVVLVISNKYIQSPWCDMEAKEAETQRKPIVLILTENIDEQEMSFVLKEIFNRYTRFKCFTKEEGQHEVSATWKTLSESIVELATTQIVV